MNFQGVLGIVFFIVLGWLLSEQKKKVNWKTVSVGLFLQVLLAFILTRFPPVYEVIMLLNKAVLALDQATAAGTSLVFGYLGGGTLPFTEGTPGSSFILAFRALPLVLTMSALSALLFYWNVLPKVVGAFSVLLKRSMGIGGAVGVSAAANIFVGMVEAPLLIRPYLQSLSRSELFILMTCGMSTIAGTMLALYTSILSSVLPNSLGHILTASIISAPAAITMALLLIPQEGNFTEGKVSTPSQATSSMDAITTGTSDGLKLWLNILSMLIVLVALVALVNQFLALIPMPDGKIITLQQILGHIMAPIVWLIGIPWGEAQTAGALMGTKTILNELVAYLNLASLPADSLSPRSTTIMTYAMCGFANFGSLGIMIGGLAAMAPERKSEIVALGFKSILAGTMSTMMTGAVIGIIMI